MPLGMWRWHGHVRSVSRARATCHESCSPTAPCHRNPTMGSRTTSARPRDPGAEDINQREQRDQRGAMPLGLGWPNIVSVLRILLVPVVVVLVAVQTRAASYAATAVLVVGGLTDLLDGYLARRFGSSTLTGAWLDPLSDKLLVAATIIALAAISRFPVWAAVIILAREASVTFLRTWLGTHRTSMPATEIASRSDPNSPAGFRSLAIRSDAPSGDQPSGIALLPATRLSVSWRSAQR